MRADDSSGRATSVRLDAEADEAGLVGAAQCGDSEAFGILVSRYAPFILSVTTRMLGRTPDAEDMAQETFVAAYKSLQRFESSARFSTWLYRIAVNKCRDALRASSTRASSIAVDDDSPAAWKLASENTPDRELERTELAGRLDRGIQSLPLLYRESFVLRHIEGLGYDEMSAILGVHRDTLKMRVYKARTLLCQLLAPLEGVHR